MLILRQQSHITLRVNRVVEMPVGHRTARKARLEVLRITKHGLQRHMPPVTPAPNSNTIRIHIRQRLEIPGAVSLISKLLFTELEMNWFFKNMAAARRPAIVQCKNNVPLLSHEFVPQKGVPAPGIEHHLRVRPS